MIELAIIMAIAAIAFGIGASVFWLLGYPFGFQFKDALLLACIALVFVFPGTANLWIMFRGGKNEQGLLRATAGVRGFGMLICAAGVSMEFTNPAVDWRHACVLYVVGGALWWGTLPVEGYYNHRQLRKFGPPYKEAGKKAG